MKYLVFTTEYAEDAERRWDEPTAIDSDGSLEWGVVVENR